MTNLQQEIWKDVAGYEGCYMVSNFGRVKSLARNVGCKDIEERILKPRQDKDGYVTVVLFKRSNRDSRFIHRLVAFAFVDNPNNYLEVNHIDSVRDNNNSSNIEWVSRYMNVQHAHRFGRGNGRHRPIVQADLNGNIIRGWSSIKETALHGYTRTCVVDCLKGRAKTHRGFTWHYAK